MNFLDSVKNLLSYINENWTVIIIIIGLGIALGKKISAYVALTTDEKIAVAKKQIREIVLKLVSDAELDYEEWKKAGSIKRSQVMQEIFIQFPVLTKVADQDEIIAWMDEIIDEALDTMRGVFEENKKA